MSEEDFAHHTAALATNKLQRDTTLVHEGDRAWEQVCVAGRGGRWGGCTDTSVCRLHRIMKARQGRAYLLCVQSGLELTSSCWLLISCGCGMAVNYPSLQHCCQLYPVGPLMWAVSLQLSVHRVGGSCVGGHPVLQAAPLLPT
jgi:hypothetical protein